MLNLQNPHGWQPLQNKSFCFKLYPAKNFMSVLSTVCAMIDSIQSMVSMCCMEYASFAGLRPKSGIWCTKSLTDFFKNILVGDHYWLHWKSGYTAIWAILAQHRGTFIHGHKDLRNHWEGMRMQLLPVCIISLSWYSAWIVAVENSFLLILLQRCS